MPLCDIKIGLPRETLFQFCSTADKQQHYQSLLQMDSPSAVALALDRVSTPSSNDENLRVKLLCSFSGSIMPRPQDGKLRYVGGETRIVSLPRDIGYEVLMVRMRELYEDATLLKYQQPDEDVDALVSVVNDDDVTNMMEEYDKLGSGDGFTRLRIFLFSHPEQETSPHFVDAHERNSERRYVDALNSLDEASDFRNHQQSNFSAMSSVDEALIIEQFYNQASLEGSIHNQGSCEMHTPQFNLRSLKIPIMGSGQPQQFGTQRYKEMEAPWSPAYYSPRHDGHHDVRPLTEFQSSPSTQLHIPPGDLGDKMPQEYIRQQMSHQSQYDHHHFTDSVVRLPPGAISGDKTSFQGNVLHGSNVFEGNSIFECRPTNFQRGQAYSDSHWRLGEQSQFEHSNFRNGIHHVDNSYESPPNRDTLLLNKDKKLTHRIYLKEHRGPQTLHDELHGHERGWLLQHHLKPQAEEIRTHTSGAGRLADHYIVDGPAINFSHGHGNLSDDYHESSNCVHHEGTRYIQVGTELGKEVFCDQVVAAGPHVHIPLEEHGVQYGNPLYAHGAENSYQVSHGHIPAHALRRNSQTPMHGAPYEISNSVQQANGTAYQGFFKSTIEGDPSFITGAQNQNTRVESSSEMLGVVGSAVPEYSYGHTLRLNSSMIGQGSHHHFGQDQIQFQPDVADFVTDNEPIQYSHPSSTFTNDKLIISTVSNNIQDSNVDGTDVDAVKRVEKSIGGKGKITDTFDGKPKPNISYPRRNEKARKIPKSTSIEPVNFNSLRRPPEHGGIVKPDRSDLSPSVEDSEHSSKKHLKPFDSVKRDALEVLEEVKAPVHCHIDAFPLQVSQIKEAAFDELETAIAKEESEYEIEIDNQNTGDIEPSKAEEDAIARGLQTIKNEDLEEIRELGSGTYGAVYYGKWKGSDVAIKRIKASCFAGRPSERDRLISDFWKEAQTLSSLHHPNVVSFYGIVRDGPDKSLATVTEYMVNGSLKQFLKKKDRTIDRRKRLIIAMDTAFGMEYLHGKNIVHFDLKCENLLVNMRDPHRPICKIGDLGLSKVKQRTLVSGGVRGTLSWMAPELLSGKSTMVTEKIDVYSFGIVMWEMLTGEEPYVDRHCASIIGGIVSNSLRPQIPTWCDPEWKSLMESCWASDPVDRPSFLEISHKLRSMAMAINVK